MSLLQKLDDNLKASLIKCSADGKSINPRVKDLLKRT
jgi:hypothetical protein